MILTESLIEQEIINKKEKIEILATELIKELIMIAKKSQTIEFEKIRARTN